MRRISIASFTLLATLISLQSQARLGGAAESMANTQAKMSNNRLSMKASAGSGYTTQEVTSDAFVVTEYLDSAGVVFAVSWSGVGSPDLSIYLGSYYNEYTAKAKADRKAIKRKGRVPEVTTEASNVVVIRKGHMRDWHGFAYIPSMVPSDVNIEELQK